MNLVSLVKNHQIESELEYSSIEELAAIITSYDWSPGIFRERIRQIPYFSKMSLFVVDVDDGCTLEEAKEIFKSYQHIIATTRNHRKNKYTKSGIDKGIKDRFRVILFLSSPIFTDPQYKNTFEKARKLWPFIDESCKDSTRLYYRSPEIISINPRGDLFEPELSETPTFFGPIKLEAPKNVNDLGSSQGGTKVSQNETETQNESRPKGDLWKSTLKFLLEGAPPGRRHFALVNAVGNMREQGYSKEEVIEAVFKMADRVGDPAFKDRNAIATINRMFNRPTKYHYKTPPEENKETYLHVSSLLSETVNYLNDKDLVRGDPTGIEGLDKMLGGGFRLGELTVLMAQAKTGKNAFYHFLIHKQLSKGVPVAYASRELNPAREVSPNLLSIEFRTNLFTKSLNDVDIERIKSTLESWPLYFAPGYGHFSATDIDEWMRSMADIGVYYFLFDHFHYALLKEDHESTSLLIKQLKTLTKELNIHLSLIVQPRTLREGEQLNLNTLRGGSSIGQALDNLLILERVPNEENISKLTLDKARHRLARPGVIYLKYDPDTMEFQEVQKNLIQEPTKPKQPLRLPRLE